jgi:thiamine-phosphate pyrophosphorylase
MLRYYITDRRAAGGEEQVLEVIARGGFDYVQIREKDLSARQLLSLVERAVEIARPRGIKVLVNERADVAMVAGADGVHLPSNSIRPSLLPKELLVGVSCHSVDDVIRAEAEGAHFVVLGPVYDTPSKREYGAPLGLDVLREACRAVSIPVFALGGVTEALAAECMAAGASGVAAITMFQAADALEGRLEPP